MLSNELATGALVEVLSHLAPPPEPIHAVYQSQKNLAARTRAFLDLLADLPGLGPRPRSGRRAGGRF